MQHGNFAQIDALHAASGLPPVDGVVADLGLSSMQLDDASRGFSFNSPGPLDMRMDPGSETTAADLVNHASERELADIFFKLGEERHSRRIARAIVKARPYRVTTELAQVVTRAIPSRAGLHQIHPATRSFMALRLAVNAELENLEQFLDRVLMVLRPGGRIVILSFHSLEDRRVKQAFRRWQGEGRASILTRKVVRPGEEEVQDQSARTQRQAAGGRKAGNREQGIGDRGWGLFFPCPLSRVPCPGIQMATAAVTLPRTRRRPRNVPGRGPGEFPGILLCEAHRQFPLGAGN